MRRSPLIERHRALGARLAVIGDREVPMAYGDAAEEVAALRSTAGISDRSDRCRITIAGADRQSFLHGQCTNDVASLKPGAGHHVAFLSGKGKMRGDGLLYCHDDRFTLSCEGAAGAPIRSHLESFIIMEDVTLEDASAETVELGVHGPEARKVLDEAGLAVPATLPEHHFHRLELDGGDVMIAHERALGLDGFELIAAVGLADQLWTRLAGRCRPVGWEAMEIARMEAGKPRWGAELDDTTNPIEAHLRDAIHLDSGCFAGYEVLARIRTYGDVNRRLLGLLVDGDQPPQAGSDVVNEGKVVGKVRSAVRSPTLARTIALAMVRRELDKAGTRLEIRGEASSVGATVTDLPFVG